MSPFQLTIAVVALAFAQALTILLTIGREREIKQLRELITEQRMLIAQMRAWMSGRMQSAQPRRIKADREPMRESKAPPVKPPTQVETREDTTKGLTTAKPTQEPIAEKKAQKPEIKLKDLHDTVKPRTPEDETKEDATKRLTKVTDWLKEDVAKAREIVAARHGKPPDQ
jgi:uncharacterized coiled-coil protein SlyX